MIILEDVTKFEKSANLESANKFKNKLFCTFSHELRTPLNGSMGYI